MAGRGSPGGATAPAPPRRWEVWGGVLPAQMQTRPRPCPRASFHSAQPQSSSVLRPPGLETHCMVTNLLFNLKSNQFDGDTRRNPDIPGLRERLTCAHNTRICNLSSSEVINTSK